MPIEGRLQRRRDCVGELIQIDGTEHRWFEAHGAQCTLFVYIDYATSWLTHLQFAESESTFDCLAAIQAYLERHAKPVEVPNGEGRQIVPAER